MTREARSGRKKAEPPKAKVEPLEGGSIRIPLEIYDEYMTANGLVVVDGYWSPGRGAILLLKDTREPENVGSSEAGGLAGQGVAGAA